MRVREPADVGERVGDDVVLVLRLRGLVDVLPVATTASGCDHRARRGDAAGGGIVHLDRDAVHEPTFDPSGTRDDTLARERARNEHAPTVGKAAERRATGDHPLGVRLEKIVDHTLDGVSNRSL